MRKKVRLKNKFRFTLFLVFTITVILLGGGYLLRNFLGEDQIIEEIIPTPQGRITIVNIDAGTELPIKNTEYSITDVKTGEVVEGLITDEEGRAISSPLDYETSYEIRQVNILKPYELSNDVYYIEVNDENHEIITENNWLEYIKAVETTEDGNIKITEVYMPVETVMQKPELPNGCEITSLTALLNYYGYEVSKTEMADVYLPKEPFVARNGKLFGANPYKAYAGDPRDQRGGFFVYAPPIVEAANNYLDAVGGTMNPVDVSQSTREEIIGYLNEGIPIVIWMTIDVEPVRINYSWYFHDTEEYFPAPVNLHSVVINGYVDDEVHIMDPLKGQVIYNADKFFESYYALGSHAMILVE